MNNQLAKCLSLISQRIQSAYDRLGQTPAELVDVELAVLRELQALREELTGTNEQEGRAS